MIYKVEELYDKYYVDELFTDTLTNTQYFYEANGKYVPLEFNNAPEGVWELDKIIPLSSKKRLRVYRLNEDKHEEFNGMKMEEL